MLFNVSIVLFENIINGTSNDTYSRSRLMMFFSIVVSDMNFSYKRMFRSVYVLALFGYYYILYFKIFPFNSNKVSKGVQKRGVAYKNHQSTRYSSFIIYFVCLRSFFTFHFSNKMSVTFLLNQGT